MYVGGRADLSPQVSTPYAFVRYGNLCSYSEGLAIIIVANLSTTNFSGFQW